MADMAIRRLHLSQIFGLSLVVQVPLLANATYVFAPAIGALIDSSGFRFPALLLLAAMQLCVGCLWHGGVVAQWASLVLIAFLSAVAYTMQFAYLKLSFDAECFAGLLSTVLAVQGCVGFIAWPVLSQMRPFGADPCAGNFLLLLLPPFALYSWPLFFQGEDDLRLRSIGAIGHRGSCWGKSAFRSTRAYACQTADPSESRGE